MPKRAPHPCAVHGCPRLVYKGSRCEQHRLPRARDTRPNAGARGYGRIHQKKREALIARRTYCEDPFGFHQGKQVKGTVRDHRIPLSLGGKDDETNEQLLCHPCHNYKTAHDGSRR